MKSSDMLRVSRHTHGVDGQDGDRINPISLRDDAYGVGGEIKWGLIAMIEHDVRMHVGVLWLRARECACDCKRTLAYARMHLCMHSCSYQIATWRQWSIRWLSSKLGNGV